MSGQRGTSARKPPARPSQSPTTMPSPAAARPAHAGDARHASRAAMAANETGRTSCATHTGTPAAMMVPSSRSSIIRSQAPAARIIDTAAPTPAAKTPVASRTRPSGMNVAVARAMSLPSRAARAAPRKPTQRVKCWTNWIEPGMPPATSGRTTISASGSTTIAASARLATACSAPPRARTTGVGSEAAGVLSVMRLGGLRNHRGADDHHPAMREARRAAGSGRRRRAVADWCRSIPLSAAGPQAVPRLGGADVQPPTVLFSGRPESGSRASTAPACSRRQSRFQRPARKASRASTAMS